MSDNLTLVQDAYACFGRGDVPAMLALMTPTVEWQFLGDRTAPYTASLKGTSQVAEWFGTVAQADDIREFAPQEFLVGPDHVTVLGHERTVARATGREFTCRWVHVWGIQDGRVARFFGMLDTEAAGAARHRGY